MMRSGGVFADNRRRRSRSFLGAPFAIAALVAVGSTISEPVTAEELYGLVVGIDDYVGTRNDLAGAVNDANDIGNVLKQLGAKKLIRLLDGAATRDSLIGAWNELMDLAQRGDTIIFSYAGHGDQEPETAGSER